MTFTYIAGTPPANEYPSISQPKIFNNFQYLQSCVGIDHNFTTNTGNAGDGFHKKMTFPATMGAPGFAPGVGVLYPSTTTGGITTIAMQNAGGSFNITGRNPAITANGYTCLPGDILIQWGIASVVSSPYNLVWPIAFTTFYSASLTYLKAMSSNNRAFVQFVSAPTASGATVSILNSSGSDTTGSFYFIAIGTK